MIIKPCVDLGNQGGEQQTAGKKQSNACQFEVSCHLIFQANEAVWPSTVMIVI